MTLASSPKLVPSCLLLTCISDSRKGNLKKVRVVKTNHEVVELHVDGLTLHEKSIFSYIWKS